MARSWKIDLNQGGDSSVRTPPGYVASAAKSSVEDVATQSTDIKLKERRAMQIARQPGQNLFMTGFMLYMSGAGVHIFSIMVTGMAVINPIKGMLQVHKVFATLDDGSIDLLLPKLNYLALQLVGLAVALYKCGTMGLLPLHSSDWFRMIPVREHIGYSAGGYGM